jgi:2-polyprenyl-6-methoxyphenol hydroxylase-like FAD-dependent oxidoreductase
MKLQRALIIGGGISGLATAIALLRNGVDVDMVEIGPEWKVYGAGITITGPTLRAFKQLGLFDPIAEKGFFNIGGHMFLYDGTLLSKTVAEPIEPGLPASGGIMRPELHTIMASEALKLGLKIRIGVTVDALDQSNQIVDVTFSDGSTGRYPLVIGADGIYSPTRAMLFGDAAAQPTYTGQMSWRVVAPRPPDMNVGHFFFGHRHVGGITPCSETEVYGFVLHPEPNPRRIPDEQKADFVRSLMSDFGGSLGVIRDGITEESSIVQRPFEYMFQEGPWYSGRVVLIGDAAHATTPHLASGAGMAVEDAIVLAEELLRADDVPTALAAFQSRRYERCKFVVENSVGIAKRQLENAPPDEIGMRMGIAMKRLGEPI